MSVRPVRLPPPEMKGAAKPDKEAKAFMRKEAHALFRKLFPNSLMGQNRTAVEYIRQALKDSYASGMCSGLLVMMKAAKADREKAKKGKRILLSLPPVP